MSENTITTAVETENTEITAKYFLDQIEKIRQDSKHVYDAIEKLGAVKSGCSNDIGAQGTAQALETIVQARETTNQKMIDFYTKSYKECLANDEARRDKKIQLAQQIWLSYFDHVASMIDDEDSVHQTKSNVESQLSLLVMDIMEDKIK